MEGRAGLLLLFLLCASWFCDARQLGKPELSVMLISKQEQEKESQALGEAAQNENLCTLCEEFSAEAVYYFSENKTQTEILNILHMSCSHLPSFEQQCITLVDYYAPLFFLEISTLEPAEFCQKVGLCQQVAIFSTKLREDSCELCHRAVSEMLIKLKDPDTQLEIIELLLKACDSMDSYAKKCKKMVFQYGPVILVNAEQFLEKNDICTLLHACKSSTTSEASDAIPVLADS